MCYQRPIHMQKEDCIFIFDNTNAILQINKKTGYYETYQAWDQMSLCRTGPKAGMTLPNPEDSKSEVKLTTAV